MREHIIQYYLHIIDRLERGYRESIADLMDEIFLENYDIDKGIIYINKLINEHRF